MLEEFSVERNIHQLLFGEVAGAGGCRANFDNLLFAADQLVLGMQGFSKLIPGVFQFRLHKQIL